MAVVRICSVSIKRGRGRDWGDQGQERKSRGLEENQGAGPHREAGESGRGQ